MSWDKPNALDYAVEGVKFVDNLVNKGVYYVPEVKITPPSKPTDSIKEIGNNQ